MCLASTLRDTLTPGPHSTLCPILPDILDSRPLQYTKRTLRDALCPGSYCSYRLQIARHTECAHCFHIRYRVSLGSVLCTLPPPPGSGIRRVSIAPTVGAMLLLGPVQWTEPLHNKTHCLHGAAGWGCCKSRTRSVGHLNNYCL